MDELIDKAYTKKAINILDRAVRYGFIIDNHYSGMEFDRVVNLATILLEDINPDKRVRVKAVKDKEEGKWQFYYDEFMIDADGIMTGEDGKKYAWSHYVDDDASVIELISEDPIE